MTGPNLLLSIIGGLALLVLLRRFHGSATPSAALAIALPLAAWLGFRVGMHTSPMLILALECAGLAIAYRLCCRHDRWCFVFLSACALIAVTSGVMHHAGLGIDLWHRSFIASVAWSLALLTLLAATTLEIARSNRSTANDCSNA